MKKYKSLSWVGYKLNNNMHGLCIYKLIPNYYSIDYKDRSILISTPGSSKFNVITLYL